MEVATAEADTNEAAVHMALIAEQKGKKSILLCTIRSATTRTYIAAYEFTNNQKLLSDCKM